MKTLHIAPGDSAGGSLKRAIIEAGRDEEVLCWRDDLSCGPINPDDPLIRAEWWAPFYGDQDVYESLSAFWNRVAESQDRLVVWFGRHSAEELSFYMYWASRMAERPYEIVDVTGLRLPFMKRDGSPGITRPLASASTAPSAVLGSLLGSERPISTEEKQESKRRWDQLKSENAPFRVVTENGLASAPVDYFDQMLLEQATPKWRKVARVVGETMGANFEPYFQVGDLMLLTRVVALIDTGRLLAKGDKWDMRSCEVRLPD